MIFLVGKQIEGGFFNGKVEKKWKGPTDPLDWESPLPIGCIQASYAGFHNILTFLFCNEKNKKKHSNIIFNILLMASWFRIRELGMEDHGTTNIFPAVAMPTRLSTTIYCRIIVLGLKKNKNKKNNNNIPFDYEFKQTEIDKYAS